MELLKFILNAVIEKVERETDSVRCQEVIYPIFKDGKRTDTKIRCNKPKGHDDGMCSDGLISWKTGYQPQEDAPDDEATVHYERSEPEPEPKFTLRARDSLAPEIVREWIFRASALGVNKDKLEDARRIANEMEDWQLTNGRKIAD